MGSTIDPSSLLPSIPPGLREPLFNSFGEITRNFRERRWEPSELNGGKLCEVIYTILKGYIDGSFSPTPFKPANMVDACRAFEQAGSSFNRSIRIQIPRMLIALYEVRSNRGVGHSGGDVNPNHMDAIAVLYMSKWLLSEIIRIFHDIDTQTATDIVDTLVDRTIPIIWQIGNKNRVLKTDLTMKDKTLVLLYQQQGGVPEVDLVSWVEHSNASVYRRDILRKLHADRLVEYDEKNHIITISPTGIRYVEESIELEL
ncbi:MAG: hypothetical protein NTW48_04875 [Chloroflexi bacterium]|nr:hypothetical protein [Chloroflexota bacterium]